MLEIYRHWHAIAAKELRPYGLKVQHAIYLLVIEHYEDGLTAARIAFLTGRDKADISRGIAALEEKQLVFRTDSDSAYRTPIRLSTEGKALAAHLRKRAALATELGGRGIDAPTREKFYETLELIDYNLQTIAQDGLPSDE